MLRACRSDESSLPSMPQRRSLILCRTCEPKWIEADSLVWDCLLVAHPGPFWRAPRPADRRHFSGRAVRRASICHPRFQRLQLPGRVLPARVLLAWRVAVMGSPEPLRHSFPGSVERDGTLSPFVALPAAAIELVSVLLLPCAPVLRGPGHVLPGSRLDPQSPGGCLGRCHLLVQRALTQSAHVAEPHRHFRMGSMGAVAGTARLASGRPEAGLGRLGRRHADVGGRPGNDCVYLVHPVSTGLWRLACRAPHLRDDLAAVPGNRLARSPDFGRAAFAFS